MGGSHSRENDGCPRRTCAPPRCSQPDRLVGMSINPDIVGRVYPAEGTYAVGREKIREFARAVHAENPLHHDVEAARAAGYADLIAPPTFAIILSQAADAALIGDKSAGIDFSRVVHADQRLRITVPLWRGTNCAPKFMWIPFV